MKKKARTTPNPLLKRAREVQGWSQEHVAQAIGTDAFTISRWERGVTTPSPIFRQKLSALFELSVTELGLVPARSGEKSGLEPILSPLTTSGATLPQPILDPALPPPLAAERGLVGREHLLRRLKQRLLSSESVALKGLPGAGKTALAAALAHDPEVRERFRDGVLWAGLVREPNVLGLLSRWAAVLGIGSPHPSWQSRPEAWAEAIHSAIGQRAMLLVIDDAWDIADALALKLGGTNCAHLVTTRFPEIALRFAGEGAATVRELSEADSQVLLLRLAPETVRDEPDAAQVLVRAVGGLPLALTLLGNYLRVHSSSGQSRRLRAALDRLRRADERLRLAEPQALIGHHPSLPADTPISLQAVIALSDQYVSAEAHEALSSLALFPPKPNTFSEEAALAVCGLQVEVIDELSDAGLLESRGPGRYTLHQTIADYARANLGDTSALERLVVYFVAYAVTHDPVAVDRESENVLSALDAAYAREMWPALVRGVQACLPWLETHGLNALAERHLRRMLAAADQIGDIAAQATAFLHLGRLADWRADYEQAQVHVRRALDLARQGSLGSLVAASLAELAYLARVQGEMDAARALYDEALATAREAGDQRSEAETLRGLGILANLQGRDEEARRLQEEALAAFRELGDQRSEAETLKVLGSLARMRGEPEEARRLYDEALALFRTLGDRRGTARTLGNMGNLLRQQGKLNEAARRYDEALALSREVGDRRNEAYTLHNWAILLVEQERHEQAERLYEAALAIFRRVESPLEVGQVLGNLGDLTRKMGHPERARVLMEEALAIFQALDDRLEAALTTAMLGLVAKEQGQLDEAHRLMESALATLRQNANGRTVALALGDLGTLARDQGQLDEARRRWEEALTLLRREGDQLNAARQLWRLGELAHAQGHDEEAMRLVVGAGIGLALADAPEAGAVESMLVQLREALGTDTALALLAEVAEGEPEPAYEMDQDAWASAVRALSSRLDAKVTRT